MSSNAPWSRLGILLLAGGLSLGSIRTPAAESTPVVLTAEEQAWIAANPVVKVGFSPSFPPYSMAAADGRMEGMDLDYLALISGRTGLKFTPVVAKNWPAAEEDFHAGRVGMLTALIGSTRQRETMLLSRPYIRVPMVIVSRVTSAYLLQVEDLRGLEIGSVRGTLAEDGVTRRYLSGSRLHEYESTAELLKGLARGEVDATLVDAVVAAYNIKSLHLTNLRMGSVIGEPFPLHLGVARGEPVLASILDKAIASITTQERRAIDERWISVEAAPSKWILAFRITAAVAVTGAIVFLLLYLRHRRRAREFEERQRILAQLEDAHQRLSRFSEQKSALMRMVAHDIRSPLTGIMLAADWARMAPPGDEAALREIIGGMRSAAQQLHRLASDLVDAQTSEDGQRVFRWERTDLRQLLDEVLATHAEAAKLKRIRLTGPEADGVSLVLVTDPAALRQVLDNLLSNAIKYTRLDTEVRITARWIDGKLRVAFADHGPGIRPEDLEYIFLRYGKGAARPTGGEQSTGLGLWIVESLITGLQGWVSCESTVGRGSTFVIELPAAPTDNPPPPRPNSRPQV